MDPGFDSDDDGAMEVGFHQVRAEEQRRRVGVGWTGGSKGQGGGSGGEECNEVVNIMSCLAMKVLL